MVYADNCPSTFVGWKNWVKQPLIKRCMSPGKLTQSLAMFVREIHRKEASATKWPPLIIPWKAQLDKTRQVASRVLGMFEEGGCEWQAEHTDKVPQPAASVAKTSPQRSRPGDLQT